MSADLQNNQHPELPEWAECDLFCIRDYAGTGNSSCGWRGRFDDARRGANRALTCPRCGGSSLLRIPLQRDGETAL